MRLPVRHRPYALAATVALSALGSTPTPATAQVTGVWGNPAGGNWSLPGNWTSAPAVPGVPGGTQDVAQFLGALNSGGTVTIDQSVSLNRIVFDNAAASFTLAGPNALTLTGSAPTVSVLSGTHAIQTGLVGTAGLTVTGPGTLVLSGANAALSGGFTIGSGGTLRFANAGAMAGGTTQYTLNGGTLSLDFGVESGTGRTLVLNNVAGNRIEVTAGNTATMTGLVSGAGGFIKTGAGTLSLAAANTFGGPATVTAGTLRAAGPGALPAGTALTIDGGTFDVATTGAGGTPMLGSVTLANGVIVSSNGPSAGGGLNSASWTLRNGLVAASLGGTNGVTKSGIGTVTLLPNPDGSAYAYNSSTAPAGTAGLSINGGAVYLATASGTVLGATSNAIALNGGTIVFGTFPVGALDANRSLTLGASPANVIDGGTGGANTFQGQVVGSAGGDGGVHKTGTSTFAIANGTTTPNNSYTGRTTVWAGDLRAPLGASGLPSGSPLVLAGGVFTPNATAGVGTFTRTLGTGNGQVAWAANADGGFAAFGGPVTVNLNGNTPADTLVWGITPHFVQTGRVLILGAGTANGTLAFQNPIDLNGGTRTILVPRGAGADSAVLAGGLADTVGGGGLVKAGDGPLIIPGIQNMYSGPTTITGGALQFALAGLPAGNVTLAGGVLQTSSSTAGTLSLGLGVGPGQVRWAGGGGFAAAGGGALTVNLNGNAPADTLVWGVTPSFVPAGRSLVFGSPTGTSGVTLANPVDLNGGTRTVTVAGGVATLTVVNGSLTKAGVGTLALGAGSNLHPAGTLTTLDGGSLALNGNQLTVAVADLAGDLNPTGGGSLAATSAFILRDNTLVVSAPLNGTAALIKAGQGTATLAAASGYTGPTVVNGTGRLLVSGSILNTSAITINGTFPAGIASVPSPATPSLGGMLTLSQSTGQDRVNTPATGPGSLPVAINGGSLTVTGSPNPTAAAVSQSFAGLTLGPGGANIYLVPNPAVAGQTIALNFTPASGDALTASSGATLLVAGPNLGTTTQVSFAGTLPVAGIGSMSGAGPAGTPTVGVLRGVFGDTGPIAVTGGRSEFAFAAAGTGLTTYDRSVIRFLTTSEYAVNTPTPAPGANLRITDTTALAEVAASVNSLVIVGSPESGVPVALNPTAANTVLTVGSGNVLIAGGHNISRISPAVSPSLPGIGTGSTAGFTLAFGSAPANFVVGNPTSSSPVDPVQLRAVLQAAVTTTGGLVKSGPGILSWDTANGTSDVTGGVYLNAGTLSVASVGGTIGTSNPITFGGGTLQYTGASVNPPGIVTTLTGPVALNAAGGTIDTPIGGGSAGAGASLAARQLPDAAMLFTGVVSGPGRLTKSGAAGGVILQNNNTYSGGTVLNGGYLVVPTANADRTALLTTPLGTGPLILTTGTLMPAGFAGPPGGNALTLSNPVSLNGEATIGYVGPTGGVGGFSPFAVAGAAPARLTLAGPITLTTGFGHVLTNNNPANVGGYSLILSGPIGESTGGTNLVYSGVGPAAPPGSSPLYTPSVPVPPLLTGTAVTGVNTYTGQTTVRQGMVNPNANVLPGVDGPFGNSVHPVVIGDPGGGAFAGVLLNGDHLTFGRNVQLQMAGTGGAPHDEVAAAYLGTLPGSVGGAITGGIQTANRTLSLFSGGGTLSAPLVVSGVITGDGRVDIARIPGFANGVAALAAANAYGGGTTVSAGTLLVNNAAGSGTGSGPVSVAVTGTLGGTGTVAGATTVAGTLQPGTGLTAAGELRLAGGLTLLPGSTLAVTAGAGGNTTVLLAGGSLVLPGGVVNVALTNDGSMDLSGATGYSLTVISGAGLTTGFNPANFAITPTNFAVADGFTVTNPGGAAVVIAFTPVPEPAAVLLVAAGALALGRRFRRRA